MPASYNRVILVGNLTRDPQLTYLPSQTPVVEFGLAVNRQWRDQQGNKREDVCFVDCRLFGKGAEIVNQYTAKGRLLLVEGRLELHTWEAQDGSKRSKHRVFVENFQFMDAGGARSDAPGGGAPRQQAPGRQPQRPAPAQEYDEQPPSSYDQPGDDDIPF